MRVVKAWFAIPFWQRVLAGFVLGALAGWLFGADAKTWFEPLGDVYVNLIKMIAIPLVFFAVISAVGSLHGQKSIAALGGRTFAWFAITAVLAVCVGLAVGLVVQPGSGVSGLQIAADYKPKQVPGPLDVLFNIVPQNPFRALSATAAGTTADGQSVLVPSNGTVLQVIFFAGLIGFAFVRLGEKTANLRRLAGEASETMIQVTRFVLEFTPLGTFGLIAGLVGAYGFEKLLPLGNFVIALYVACALHIVVVYSGLLLAHGLNPLKFFRGAASAMQVGFVASSSFAAMPASLRSAVHNHGVDRDYAAFAIPLGASIKMDGCGAIYPALAAVFIAQYTGIELSLGAVLHHHAGIGAGQLRHGRRARHRGHHGDGGAERCGIAAGGDRLSLRHRPRARHDAHDDQRHRADAGSGAGGEGNRAARSRGVRRGFEQYRHRGGRGGGRREQGRRLMDEDIELIERFPGVEDYRRLRVEAGLSAKTAEAATRGLANTLYGVSLVRDGAVVGMGRIIGDNGTVFTVVDIAIVPALQGRGLGRRILVALDAWLQANVPESAYVTLVADGDAKYLYAKFGFAESAPFAVNMEYIMGANGERLPSMG